MSQKKILKAYEQLAESYNEKIDYKPHNAFYDRPNTLSLFPDEAKGLHILDAACGPGKYAEILLAQGAQVTGFDVSPKMIALAKERNKAQGDFFVHSLSSPLTTLQDQSFDVVLSALALHYIEDWNPTMLEFHRLLKPFGKLIISIEHPFFEYNYHQSKEYFKTEAVSATWGGFGTPIEVPSFKRSLQSCLLPLTENGFYIDKLIEPRPTAEFKKLDPRHYKELNEFPSFMCIRAAKRSD